LRRVGAQLRGFSWVGRYRLTMSTNIPHIELADDLFRLPRVRATSGHCRSTLYRLIGAGLWTRPVRLGPRAVAWPSSEVAALNAARIAGMTDDEIRTLVRSLEAGRRNQAILTRTPSMELTGDTRSHATTDQQTPATDRRRKHGNDGAA
jgi:prophage regulatory protein